MPAIAGCSGDSPVTNNTNITITKLWETAQLTGRVSKGLHPHLWCLRNLRYDDFIHKLYHARNRKIDRNFQCEFFPL